MSTLCRGCGWNLAMSDDGYCLACESDHLDVCEGDAPTDRGLDDMYPEWSGSLGTTLRGLE